MNRHEFNNKPLLSETLQFDSTRDAAAVPQRLGGLPCSPTLDAYQRGKSAMKTQFTDKIFQALIARGTNLVDDDETMNEVVTLRRAMYEGLYPEVVNDGPDYFDKTGLVLYSRDKDRNLMSTARIALDGVDGLPSESVLRPLIPPSHRNSKLLAEIGKFAIKNDSSGKAVRNMFASYYLIGIDLNLSFVFLASNSISRFYQQIIGAHVLAISTGKTFGSKKQFAAYFWKPDESGNRFRNWAGF